MAKIVVLPLWLALAAGAVAAWALCFHILLPGIRWFFRRREEIFIQKIHKHLNLRLPAFKLTRKKVIVDRLMSDPSVLKAIDEHAQEQKIPAEAAMKMAESYAREIVPSFHAYAYFLLGSMVGISLSRLLYRVRVGYADEEGLAKVPPLSTVVFVMNHRSNMDYILLGSLTARRAVLSFAVGEWARVWPVKPLVKALGAYFVRRHSGNTLYRRVLARYVQMTIEGGLVQAVFPEGKLSRDGRLHEPKLGLLDYMLRDFSPDGERDLVFIPAGINYDRVLEDRTLLLEGMPGAKNDWKKALFTTLSFILRNIWLMLRGGWHRFGYANVYFGAPFSIQDYAQAQAIDFRRLSKDARIKQVQRLADELFDRVGRMVPVLPVSLIASIFIHDPETLFSDAEIRAKAFELIGNLKRNGAHVYIPRKDRNYAIQVGLRMLTLRHLVQKEEGGYRAAASEMRILDYYASSISHLVRSKKE
jgi:glycerol-3-phosphate O-acyltransferase